MGISSCSHHFLSVKRLQVVGVSLAVTGESPRKNLHIFIVPCDQSGILNRSGGGTDRESLVLSQYGFIQGWGFVDLEKAYASVKSLSYQNLASIMNSRTLLKCRAHAATLGPLIWRGVALLNKGARSSSALTLVTKITWTIGQ